MYKKLTVVLVIVFFFVGCSSSFKLSYKGSAGEIRQYQTNMDMEQSMEMMGNEMSSTMQIVNFITQKILEVDKDGAYKAIFVYDSVSFDATGPQLAAMKDKVTEKINELKGIEIEFKISERGEILEHAEIDSLIPEQMRQFFNPRQSFSAFTPRLPDKPIKIGESWEVKENKPVNTKAMKMKIDTETKYTLASKETEDGSEFLKVTSTGKLMIEGEGEQMGTNIFIEGDGDVKGEFLFDEKNGLYYSGSSETEMDMTIAITGGTNMTMPMTQFIKVKITKIK